MRAICSKRILTPEGWREGVLLIERGVITEILPSIPSYFVGSIDNADDLAVLPGVVDTHVHVNEPGRTEWEGYESATHGAARGGTTTLVDMPLNCSPVTTTSRALKEKLSALKNKLFVDCGFWGGVVPGSIDDLSELTRAGVLGVKSFLIDSGIDEFPEMKIPDLERAMKILKDSRLPYLLHAELDNGEAENVEISSQYASFLASRPRSFENQAIEAILETCERTGCRTHIVHLSSSDALSILKNARSRNLPVSVETCPHYLVLSSEEIEDGQTLYKCCPPIREAENRESLWSGLKQGIIDFVVSDHSPCTPSLKLMESGDLEGAWGGISSLQFSFSLVWTEASRRGIDLSTISRLMSLEPARFAGLAERKGSLEPGKDADLFFFDPEESYALEREGILHRHSDTPYLGRRLKGSVKRTYLRGEIIYDNGNFPGIPGGRPLLKELK
ncbi:allantoinase AllB [bacterium]|jgi:allantoinase|nr:allantoinase AllB [bacterium]